jgi:hypothetical protein
MNKNDPNDPNDPDDPNDSNVSNISNDPAVLWRMTRGRNAAHATIFPGDVHTTVTWFFDGVMDRAEQYDSIELAMARAEEIRGILVRDGWKET